MMNERTVTYVAVGVFLAVAFAGIVILYGKGIQTTDQAYIRIREVTRKKLVLTDLKTGETTEFERVK